MTLVEQGLLVAAVLALAAASLRVAALTGAAGLARVVAAAPLGAAAAVIEALLLGRAGLAGSPAALTAAAVLTWAIVRLAVPAPADSLGLLPATALAAAGALAGVAAWALVRPYFGLDGSTYHLSMAVRWVQRGSTGSVEPLVAGISVGNYPVTNETILAWGMGISHSFVPVALWTAAPLGLFVGAAWLGLRALRVDRLVAALAIAAVCATPVVIGQVVQPQSDFAALAWLATAAALAASARSRPALLAPAVVAAGLAVGTKTTTLPLAAIAIGAAAWSVRGELRPLARALSLAAVAAVGAGGVWYLRNLFDHGSPLWPLASTSWGDPVPPIIRKLDYSLLQRPVATLRVRGLTAHYRDDFAGALVLVAGALLVPLLARSRAALAAGGAVLLALLLWANTPFTGVGHDPGLAFWPVNTLRYALPVIAAAALALAVASCTGVQARRATVAVLVAALAWNLVRDATGSFDFLRLPLLLAGLMAAGGAIGLALARLWPAPRPARVAAAALAAVALALAVPGYVQRDARSGDAAGAVVDWLRSVPGWSHGSRPAAASPWALAPLAGDRLRHPIAFAEDGESCARLAARARRGSVTVFDLGGELYPPASARRCLARATPRFQASFLRVYGDP